ncbi:hypothetical protein DM02DRAFT_636956 [Periconia macrospinosa]|uniref:MADS-box domain-containing protein n=1 Tax=Periconia macrospinosa TaxID=97972 RepID=A0A2V1CYA9_9PLEO|nr:hypothetical protein DM02DRAFT_636956 [Periconia macrospinosa]
MNYIQSSAPSISGWATQSLPLPLPRMQSTPPPFNQLKRRHSIDSSDNIQAPVAKRARIHKVLQSDGLEATNRIRAKDEGFRGQAPNLRARTNTLFRKASQLANIANAEVYLTVRYAGECMVYNSADPDSSQPPVKLDDDIVSVVVC